MPVTPEFFSFLVENRLHDSKGWFEEHREDYNRLVLEPLRGLVEEMSPILLPMDSLLVTQPRVGKTISRIFRDTRFSRDKSAFREHLWISFHREKRERFQPVPELFLDLSPEGYTYGCGWYCPGPELMEIFRRLVLEGDKTASRAVRAMARQKLFVMDGDLYRRPKHPEAPADLSPWVNRKELYFTRTGNDPAFLYAPDLGRRVAEDLRLLEPFYNLLWKAQDTARAEAPHPLLPQEEW
jgi:uncharacterized protein (TIGR02453 family)